MPTLQKVASTIVVRTCDNIHFRNYVVIDGLITTSNVYMLPFENTLKIIILFNVDFDLYVVIHI